MSPGDRMTIRGILEAVALISCLTISGFATEAPQVYVHHCVSCHGSDGSGRKTPAWAKFQTCDQNGLHL